MVPVPVIDCKAPCDRGAVMTPEAFSRIQGFAPENRAPAVSIDAPYSNSSSQAVATSGCESGVMLPTAAGRPVEGAYPLV